MPAPVQSRPGGQPDAGGGSVYSPAHRGLTAGIVLSILAVAFEAIGVATAFPVIARDLDGLGLYALGFSAFLTTSLFGMVLAGELCDRRPGPAGPRLPYLASIVAFGTGLVLAGVAPSMYVLIAGRALQGLGAGLSIVSVYVIIARAYPEVMRPRMFAVLSSAWVLPSILGPAAAGWLADHVSWRLVFLGVLPLLVPGVLLVAPRLRPGPAPGGTPADGPGRVGGVGNAVPAVAGTGRARASGRKRSALAAAAGAGLLQYAGAHPTWPGVLLAAPGLALLLPALPRLLPPGTLRAARGLPTAVLMRGLLAGAFFGAEVFVPLMLTQERGLSTTLAGFSLTGAALGWAAGSWYQGRPALRLPRATLVRTGCLSVAGGIVLVAASLAPAAPAYVAAIGWTFAGLGMGLALSTLSVIVLEHSPPQDAGANSAALQVSDALGSIACIGLAGAVFAALRSGAGQDRPVFLAIWLTMIAVALAGAWLAPRVRRAVPVGAG